ncbi:MAG TPA: cupin domain-containing protein [Candidatus Polarisedimenticolia bacterium]|nr:cupin domain-containing protein [Candidatus Polarisedimenticolia bacterium]
MSRRASGHGVAHVESVCRYAFQALPAGEVAAVEAQITACPDCRRELLALHPVADALVAWPGDLLRPSPSLRDELARRIGAEAPLSPQVEWHEPEWEEVAPGISCRFLATDAERDRVTLLVRLAPGTEYPPHVHAGIEELHMLEGELAVDDRKLVAGDYLRSEPGTRDRRVWSETGCTGILITSRRDVLL